MTEKRETRNVKYQFTRAELGELSDLLATAVTQRGDLERQKKSFDAQLKGQIEAESERITVLAAKVTSKFEMRDVEVTFLYDVPLPGQKTAIRVDTGAECGVEQMNDRDRQGRLSLATESEGSRLT